MFNISKYLPVILLLLSVGCSLFYSALPVVEGPALQKDQQEKIIDSLLADTARVSSLRAVARTEMNLRGDIDYLRQIVVFERPDRLRLEYMPTHAIYTLSLLTVDSNESVFIDVVEKKAWRGSQPASLLQKLMRAPISVSELTAILVGRIPEDLLRSEQLSIYQGKGGYQLLSTDFSRVAIIDAKSLLLRRFEVRTSSGRRINLVVVYGGYQQVDGVSLPGSLTIEVPEKGFVMRLQLNIVSVNQDYPDSLFRADVPGNFSVEELGF